MEKSLKTILVTGFGPFPGAPFTPTERPSYPMIKDVAVRLLRELARRLR